MLKKLALFGAFFVCCGIALASNPARFDLPVVTTTPAQVPPGALPNLLAVTNATVSICGYPATVVNGMCTNTITTYTDSTLSTACPSTAQMTAPGTSVCISTTGLQGTFGFWYNAATQTHMTYTLQTSWGTYGPYDIDPGAAGSGNGTVTTYSAGNAAPLFNTSVANPTTTPALSFSLNAFAAHSFYGNNGASTATPAVSLLGVSDWSPNAFALGAGTAQAQTATLNPPATALTAGLEVRWLPVAANTAAGPTLNVNGLGARVITKVGTSALAANDLTTMAVADVIFDGTYFQLQDPQTNAAGASGAVLLSPPAANQTINYNTSGATTLTVTNPNAGSGATSGYTASNGADFFSLELAGSGTALPGAASFISSNATAPLSFETGGGPILFNAPNTNVSGALNYASDTGSANAYVVAPPSCVSATHAGTTINFKAANASTGASTLVYCSGSPVTLYKNGSTALTTGDILAGAQYSARFDGTNWQLLNSSLTGSSLPTATAQYQVPLASGAGTTYAAGLLPFGQFANQNANLSLSNGSYTTAFAQTVPFTASVTNLPFSIAENGLNFQTELQDLHNTSYWGTEGFAVGMAVSGTGTNESHTLSSYTTCSSTTIYCVGIYGQERATGAGALIYGINANVMDNGFNTPQLFASEFDAQVTNTSTTGELVRLAANVPSGGATYNGVHLIAGANPLTNGYLFDNNSVTTGINLGYLTGPAHGIPIQFNGPSSDYSTLEADLRGNLNVNGTDSSGYPLFNVNLPGTFGSGTYPGIAQFRAAGAGVGSNSYINVGTDAAANDSVNLMFHEVGAGSTSNYFQIELAGNGTNAITLDGNGNVVFAGSLKAGTSSQFQVSGAGAVTAPSIAAGTSGNATIDTSGNISTAAVAAATSSTNVNSPNLNLLGHYWTGSASATDTWSCDDNLSSWSGSPTNAQSILDCTHSGSPGGAYFRVPSLLTTNLSTAGGQSSADFVAYQTSLATSGANYNSPGFDWHASYWTGSASNTDEWTSGDVLGAGTNPTTTWTLTHYSGTSGLAAVSFGSMPVTAGSFTTSGSTPKIATGTASNTDVAGQLTLSSGTATYTFANTYTSAPICVATDTTAASAVKVGVTTTVLTLTGTSADVLNYICIGRN